MGGTRFYAINALINGVMHLQYKRISSPGSFINHVHEVKMATHQQIASAYDAAFHLSQHNVDPDGVHKPLVIFFEMVQDRPGRAAIALFPLQSPDDKVFIKEMISGALLGNGKFDELPVPDDFRVDLVVQVNEAWGSVVHVNPNEAMVDLSNVPAPSQDPNRIDVLSFLIHSVRDSMLHTDFCICPFEIVKDDLGNERRSPKYQIIHFAEDQMQDGTMNLSNIPARDRMH